MDVERFRETLRILREELVGTQKALSTLTKKSGSKAVNTMTISEIETGAIKNPGILTVVRIVEAIPGMTLSSFFASLESGHDARSRAGSLEDHGSPLTIPSNDEATAKARATNDLN